MDGKPQIVTADDVAPPPPPVPTAPAVEAAPAPAPAVPPAADPADPLQLDKAGVPFDAAKHLRRKHPATGRWMPKGGRRPKSATFPSTPAAEGPPPPAPSFVPKVAPPPPAPSPDAEPSASAGPAPEPVADHSREAGECAAHALQFLAGTVFDAHADCAASPGEHRGMVEAFAAYVRSKGWQATAGAATFLVVVAYLLRVIRKDKPRAKLSAWIAEARAATAKNVTPPENRPAAPTPAAPAPAPAPVPAAAPRAAQVLPFNLADAEFQ